MNFPQAIILMNFKGKKKVQFDIACAQLVHKNCISISIFYLFIFLLVVQQTEN